MSIVGAVMVPHPPLIVPEVGRGGESVIREMSRWIAGLTDRAGRVIGENIPLHISRFFPRFRMTDRNATDVRTVYRLADTAGEYLRHVYRGNC